MPDLITELPLLDCHLLNGPIQIEVDRFGESERRFIDRKHDADDHIYALVKGCLMRAKSFPDSCCNALPPANRLVNVERGDDDETYRYSAFTTMRKFVLNMKELPSAVD